jgi:hypothetical protein
MLFTICLAVSEVVEAIWVLAIAQVIILEVVIAGAAVVVGSDMVVAWEAQGAQRGAGEL